MWSEGVITCPSTGGKYEYWVKHYKESSPFGIDGGKISKLTIRKFGETRDLCSYDRGWDIKPTDEVKAVYTIILSMYN